jgi:AraC-like DNA-binding protein
MDDYPWIRIIGYFHLVAGIQGLFLVAILRAYPAENKVPNKFLALFILAFSVIILGVGLGATGLYQTFPHLIRIGAPFLALLGPALLFYITAIRIGKVPSVQYLHLIPFALYVISLLPFYFSSAEEKIYWVEVAMTTGQADAYINLLFVMHFLGYLIWIYLILIRHSGTASAMKTDLAETDLGWIRSLTSMLLLCGIIAIGMFGLSAAGVMETLLANYLAGFVMALIVYVMGYRSLITPKLFGDRDYPAWEYRSSWDLFWGHLHFNPKTPVSDQFKKEEQKLLAELQAFMESKKPYRNSDLSLATLSSQTGIPQYQLSRIINGHLEQNFFDFINEYRVKEVCERLSQPDQHRYTILSLAMDAGFNSKSSFNTAFRKSTGLTPSEFKKKQLNR